MTVSRTKRFGNSSNLQILFYFFPKKVQNIYASDILCLFELAQKLASLKKASQDTVSLVKAQVAVEELIMFLDDDSLEGRNEKEA